MLSSDGAPSITSSRPAPTAPTRCCFSPGRSSAAPASTPRKQALGDPLLPLPRCASPGHFKSSGTRSAPNRPKQQPGPPRLAAVSTCSRAAERSAPAVRRARFGAGVDPVGTTASPGPHAAWRPAPRPARRATGARNGVSAASSSSGDPSARKWPASGMTFELAVRARRRGHEQLFRTPHGASGIRPGSGNAVPTGRNAGGGSKC